MFRIKHLSELTNLPLRIGAAVAEYIHTDHLGSPVAATNGAVTWRERYLPFGGACSHDALSNSFVERRRSQAPAVML